jgi:glycosyltransferase involved in cell wall biosynthesis
MHSSCGAERIRSKPSTSCARSLRGKPMRVALVVPGGVDRSGEYRVIPAVLSLIARLSLRHDVQVFALSQEARPGEWDLAGAHIRNIGAGHTVYRAVRSIRSQHRLLPFDIVHAIWSGWPGLIAVMSGRILGIPSVVHIAGGELVSIPDIAYGGSLTWRGRLREVCTLRFASAITAASVPVVATLSRRGHSALRVPLGVDLTRWPPRPPVRRDSQRPARLIHVASLNLVKDQPTLLRALCSLARSGVRFTLDIVGDDTLHGKVQALAGALGLSERVRFRGFLPQRELRPLVEAADLMLLSSRHETGPLVMLEAAVAGVPTVGTAVGHLQEWSAEAAVSVPVGDWQRLAQAIAGMLEDEELRLRIAREAFSRAVREDADYTASRFQALYVSLVRSPQPRA